MKREHKCDRMPEQASIKQVIQLDWYLRFEGATARVEYCPFCGKSLDQENHAKESVALMLSGYLDISEESAQCLVDTLIEAVKHELK